MSVYYTFVVSGLYLLDLIGVFAFAVFGARKGLERRFDTFGVLTCAFLVALGGGTIREMVLGNQPAYLHDPVYVCVMVAGAAFALATEQNFQRFKRPLLVLDAIGLATFAYIGADRASDAGLGLAAMGIFAVLTAAGGGILADVVCRNKPTVFAHDFYALPALLLAFAYFLLEHAAKQPLIAYSLVGATCATRLGYLYMRSDRSKPRQVMYIWRLALSGRNL